MSNKNGNLPKKLLKTANTVSEYESTTNLILPFVTIYMCFDLCVSTFIFSGLLILMVVMG